MKTPVFNIKDSNKYEVWGFNLDGSDGFCSTNPIDSIQAAHAWCDTTNKKVREAGVKRIYTVVMVETVRRVIQPEPEQLAQQSELGDN